MIYQRNDSLTEELRLAQAELSAMERGLALLTADQQRSVLPSQVELEQKIQRLQRELE